MKTLIIIVTIILSLTACTSEIAETSSQAPPTESSLSSPLPTTSDTPLVEERTSGLSAFEEDGKWGILKDGEVLISAVYDYIEVHGDFVTAMSNNLFGLINSDGEIIIPIEYEQVLYQPEEENGIIYSGGKYGMFNSHGQIVLEPIYDQISIYGNRAVVYQRKPPDYNFLFTKKGLSDEEGNFILDILYDYIVYSPTENLGIAYKDGKSGIFDEQGNFTFGLMYEDLQSPDSWEASQDFIYAALDGKYGYISPENELLIDFKYDYVDEFKNGYAVVYPEHKLFWKTDENGDSIPDFVIYQYQIIDTEENILYTSPYLKESSENTPMPIGLSFMHREGVEIPSDKIYPVVDVENLKAESISPQGEIITLGNHFSNVMASVKNTEYTPSEDALPYIVYNIDRNTPYTLIPLP